jgi:hypothetical protein
MNMLCVPIFFTFMFFLGNLALCVAIINSRDTEWRKIKEKIMLFYLTFLSYHDKIHAASDLKRKVY